MDSRADLLKAVSDATRAFTKAQWDLKILICDQHNQPTNPAALEQLRAVADARKEQLEIAQRELIKFDQKMVLEEGVEPSYPVKDAGF
jgi:hypothetical protein